MKSAEKRKSLLESDKMEREKSKMTPTSRVYVINKIKNDMDKSFNGIMKANEGD